MAAVKELCKSGIFMQHGSVAFQGNIDTCVQKYLGSSSYSNIYKPDVLSNNDYVNFEKIEVLNASGINCMDFTCEDEIHIQFNFSIRDLSRGHSLFVMVNDKYGSPVFGAESIIRNEKLTLKLNKRFLTRGNYSITTFIHIPRIEQIDRAIDVCNFSITDATSPLAIHGDYEYGNVFGNYEWIEL
jgi:lipopolysaccharide transport system ATP-binding protein